jgi:bifunctional DNase/RNase
MNVGRSGAKLEFRYCEDPTQRYDPPVMRRAGLALGLLLIWAPSGRAAPVEVTVSGMRVDVSTGTPVVQLVEKADRARELPIWIGPFEAQAIALELQGVPSPRPLTHDLMKQLVERLGAKLNRVVIEDLRENTYFATVHLDGPGGGGVTVDARPSDAIALALRLHGPILVSEELFAKAATTRPTPTAAHVWGLTVQDLTPEMARFFEAPGARGVLVSDVADAAQAHEALRGDVITAIDGAPVASVDDLAKRVDARAASDPVHLSLRRRGRDVTITFAGE